MNRRWWIALALVASAVAAGQSSPFTSARPFMKATRITRDGGVMRGRGHVRVSVGPLLVESDEGWVRLDTEAVETRGHARATVPARSDRHLIRCGGRAVVSEEPVLLAADRIDVKDGLLRARGHVEVRTGTDRVQADEIDLYLNIGDGEVRGNVRLNGLRSDLPEARGFRDRRPLFPPEIIR